MSVRLPSRPEKKALAYLRKSRSFGFHDCCVAVEEVEPRPILEAAHALHCFPNCVSLLFVHGRTGHRQIWRPLIDRMCLEYRCISLDLPGFGGSFTGSGRAFSLSEHGNLLVKLVQQFADRHERIIIVAHDFGGALAELCAFLAPDRIAGLVLTNTACLMEEVFPLGCGPFGIFGRRSIENLLERSEIRDPRWRELIIESWTTFRDRAERNRALKAIQESWPSQEERRNWRRSIEKSSHPVLLLWGRRDRLNPIERAFRLMQSLPDGYFFENPDCGHWPQLEATDWFEEKLRGFLFKIGIRPSLSRVQRSLSR